MHFRSTAAVLASTSILALGASLGLAPVAQADPPPTPAPTPAPVTCTITGTSPSTFTLGVTTQPVQFGVKTSCDGTHPVSWNLTSDIAFNSPGYSWLMLRNYHSTEWERLTHVENADGIAPVNFDNSGAGFEGNKQAGPHPLYAYAFYDVNGDGKSGPGEPVSYFTGTVIAKRATVFTDFSASTDRVRAGRRIYFSGVLKRANWTTSTDDGFAAPVELQFRADGHRRFHDVKDVHNDGTAATTRVRATQSGTYRYRYLGDDISGAAYSAGAHVRVYHHHWH